MGERKRVRGIPDRHIRDRGSSLRPYSCQREDPLYAEGTLELDMSGGDPHDIAEVWFSIVPEDGSSYVIRPTSLDPPGTGSLPWTRIEPA